MNSMIRKTVLCLTAVSLVFSFSGCGKRKLSPATEAWLYESMSQPAELSPSPAPESVVWTPAPSVAPTPAFRPTPVPSPRPTFSPTPAPTPFLQDFANTSSLQGWVSGDEVNFRKLPGMDAEIHTTVDTGRELTILGSQNGWTKVMIDGTVGYIKSEYVTDVWREEFRDDVSVYTDNAVLPGSGAADLNAIQSLIFQLTNEQRAMNGLPALQYDAALQSAANIRAAEQTSLFSHTRPDGSDWSTAFPPGAYYFLGENLASCDGILADDSFARSCVKWWMESEAHRANILNAYYTSVAVGVSIAGGNMYAVQEFGTPY